MDAPNEAQDNDENIHTSGAANLSYKYHEVRDFMTILGMLRLFV